MIAAALLCGCGTGAPASTSAWQSSSERVLGAAISGLGTARIAVQQDVRGHVPHTYAVVAATDAIDTSAKEVSGYLTDQPPDGLHRANRAVAQALQAALTLLADVRVELASPGLQRSAADRLVSKIDAMTKRLDRLQTTATSSPDSLGAG